MKTSWFACGLLLVLAGCGGVSPAGDSGGTDRQYGPISTRAVGGVGEPVVMQGPGASVTGVFGANFTNVTVALAPENQLNEEAILNSTLIAYSYEGRPYLIEYGTFNQFVVNPGNPPGSGLLYPSFSGLGDQIVTSEFDPLTGVNQLFQYNVDGSGRARITSGASNAGSPSWSPTVARIAFTLNDDIWAINRDGTGLTQLAATPDGDRQPRYRQDGTRIGWLRTSVGNTQFWDMTNTGTGQTFRANLVGFVSDWDYIAGGDEIVYTTTVGPGQYRIYRLQLAVGTSQVIASESDPLFSVSAAPTGSHLVYVREFATSRNLEVLRLRDGSVSVVGTISGPTASGQFDWGPALRRRSFVAATNAVFHTNAAGFLYSMRGSDFASVLAFDAVTRNTVDIDVPASPGFAPSNLFATITAADSITMLRYANGIAVPRVTVVDPTNAATWIQGAIVSFDAQTGRVGAVVPFNRSRSGEKAKAVKEGDTVVVRGELLGVWDAEGKKSVGAASEVILDANTGKVLSHR